MLKTKKARPISKLLSITLISMLFFGSGLCAEQINIPYQLKSVDLLSPHLQIDNKSFMAEVERILSTHKTISSFNQKEDFSVDALNKFLYSLPMICVSKEHPLLNQLKDKTDILYFSSELSQLSQRGGLGDVTLESVYWTEKELMKLGRHIARVLPLFRFGTKDEPINYQKLGWELFRITDNNSKPIEVDIKINDKNYQTQFVLGINKKEGIINLFLDNEELSQRPYLDHKGDYGRKQAIWYSRASLEAIRKLEINAKVLHLNDWQTSLIAVYLRGTNLYEDISKRVGISLTVHNPKFQGKFSYSTYEETGLPWELYHKEALEYWYDWNMLKGGLIYSNLIYLPSDTFAEEIQKSPEAGHGLEGVFKKLKEKGKLKGALNGIDPIKHRMEKGETKPMNKSWLQEIAQQQNKKFKLDPNKLLIGCISRIDAQKGLDLLAKIIPELIKLNMQIVVLGTAAKGDVDGGKTEEEFKRLEQLYPENFVFFNQFNSIVKTIYRASDVFVMPSNFEPCGLGQMIAMLVETIPVVRAVGGLNDTVIDYRDNPKDGNGFKFKTETKDRQELARIFLETIKVAAGYWKDKAQWNRIKQNAQKTDSSWQNRVNKIIGFYIEIMQSLALDSPLVEKIELDGQPETVIAQSI